MMQSASPMSQQPIPYPNKMAGEEWNTEAVRELLTDALSDEELTTLCFDRFSPVYQSFSGGMSKQLKIQNLMEYSSRQNQLGNLLELVGERRPAKYAEHGPYIKHTSGPAGMERPSESAPLAKRLPGQIISILRDPLWQGIAAVVAIAALVVAIGAWIRPDIRSSLFSTSTVAPSTPTDNLSDADVSFAVTRSGVKAQVLDSNTLSLAPGETILIETNVILRGKPFPRPLSFRYSTTLGTIGATTSGSPRISYWAPGQPGSGVITVEITDKSTEHKKTKSISIVVE